jgi:(R)-2-hydroxyacyl-CoA dehydratese activating ATPase
MKTENPLLTCGVDIGARSIEVVILKDREILISIVQDSGISPSQNGEAAFREALDSAAVKQSDLSGIVSTGYGRNYFKPAHRSVSEIVCHARGASYLFPSARTVIDIGGQDSKLIELDDKGRPTDFVMNDRCAAGTGKFIEMTGSVLGIPVSEMNRIITPEDGRVDISSMCAVFAESEIVGLLHRGCTVPAILNGIFHAVAKRTLCMAGRAKIEPDVVFTGGVAKIEGIRHALAQEAGYQPLVPPDPQITGALGAALIASEKTNPALLEQ